MVLVLVARKYWKWEDCACLFSFVAVYLLPRNDFFISPWRTGMFCLSEKEKLYHLSCVPFCHSYQQAQELSLVFIYIEYLILRFWRKETLFRFLSSGGTRKLEKGPCYLFAWLSLLFGSSYECMLGVKKAKSGDIGPLLSYGFLLTEGYQGHIHYQCYYTGHWDS